MQDLALRRHRDRIPNRHNGKYILGCVGDSVGTAAKSDGGSVCTFTESDSTDLATVAAWTF